ncbi:OLC1v1017993C4 [Oldenlandia corymbosa var. corymbosa]|uniref:Methyltransferase n=1 Tax=Oldenlandia corymbosa var. corymbosa TaxID=529605 RepID=A0AAV1EAT5_OLDCO|nr:OLC1v1017993C4 [Oldenlandia corymbosa var. corymbosa]
MAIAKFGRLAKRSYKSYKSFGFGVKLTAVVILGLCFVFVWSVFSPNSFSVTDRRDTFDDIAEPVSGHRPTTTTAHSGVELRKKEIRDNGEEGGKEEKKKIQSSEAGKDKKRINASPPLKPSSKDQKKVPKVKKHGNDNNNNKVKPKKEVDEEKAQGATERSEDENLEDEKQEQDVNGNEEETENGEGNDSNEEGQVEGEAENGEGTEEGGSDLSDTLDVDEENVEKLEDDSANSKKKKKNLGPLFDPNAQYAWKLCSTRSKHNYIPCIDIEGGIGRLQGYRHHERSCPKTSVMCLVPLPHDGYGTPVTWPESKLKIMYKNVAHPKLAAFIKSQDWVMEDGDYLTFPQNQSILKGGIQHYLESVEEMVPDIEWGKNIRVVLNIGCTDSSFVASLLEKNVLVLTLGLKNDLVDLAQLALERGFPAVVSPFALRRIPFPSGVFDAIHCGECSISWHANGGKLLLEINRILRPGGYFILSSKHNSIEMEEAMSKLTASICWNILADKSDEVSDVGVKIFQKPESNDIYVLRRKKIPPLCKENENPDAAWYVSIKTCLHAIPSSIEERGTEWPEEWPKRLESFPDWINNKEKLIAENEHWKSIVNNSYLNGMGINWTTVRNVMDMKTIYGGFAAALSQQNVWVMNVVPVHAPDTLPTIYERGLIGIYHDWCESFGTYPRSYDLLHADHLFSRLKNRLTQLFLSFAILLYYCFFAFL